VVAAAEVLLTSSLERQIPRTNEEPRRRVMALSLCRGNLPPNCLTHQEGRTMRILNFGACALTSCAAAAFLAGCSGSPSMNLAAGTMPQARMKGATQSQDLLYVQGQASVSILTYPGGAKIGTLGLITTQGYCTDAAGDVFIAQIDSSNASSTIYEYASGGTTPIATLSDPGSAFGCAVDPATGNLAVTNYADHNNRFDNGDLAIYQSATGTPAIYYNSSFTRYMYCSYDDKGNLYATADAGEQPNLVGLARGSSSIEPITMRQGFSGDSVFYPSVAWDGKYITVSSVSKLGHGHTGQSRFAIYRVKIKGRNAKVVGATILHVGFRNQHLGQVWIRGGTLLAPYQHDGQWIGVWPYPKGGKPTSSISLGHYPTLSFGLTVSSP